jgi:predicted permease
VVLAVGALPAVARVSPITTDSLGTLLTDFRVDRAALLFGLAATLFSAAACGVLPALRATRRRDLSGALKSRTHDREAGAGGSGSGSLRRSLGALVVAEIALATTLLTGGGLMAKSLRGLLRLDLGFRPEGVVTAEISLSRAKYPDSARRVALFEDVAARLRRVPGVRSAGVSSNLPNDPISLDSQFEVEGRPRAGTKGSEVPITAHRLVVPGYLEALGVELVRGRLVDSRDRADTLPVAVITEELARQAWPRGDPIGKRIRRRIPGRPDAPWLTVVGIVRDTREDRFNFRVARPVWYLPWSQQPTPLAVDLPAYLAIRVEGDASSKAAALAPEIRRAVHESDPTVPVSAPVPLESRLASVLASDRFGALLLGVLAGMGVALASLGLYGVLAFSVRTRTSEIGLRMALGARPRDILRMVLARSGALFAAGLGAGLVGSGAIGRLLAASLYGVKPADPATLAFVAVILAAVALAASALPAWRAARVAPSEALRGE